MAMGALPAWAAVPERTDLEPWILKQRSEAWDRLMDTGMPTRKAEPWRYLNLRSLSSEMFQPIAPGTDLIHAVQVPDGVTVGSLASLNGTSLPLDGRLGSVLGPEVSGFASLNTANLGDATVVHVPRNVQAATPIELHIMAEADDGPTIVHPRLYVSMDEGSQATVFLHITGGSGNERLSNVVTELSVGCNAHLEFVVLQDAEHQHHSIHSVGAAVATNGSVRTSNFAVGGGVARSEVRVSLDGTGAEGWVDGAYLGSGQQQLDQYTVIDHRADHTVSGELYKGILDDESTGTFQGRILIHPQTRFCSTDQLNRNIVLSQGAVANTKPQLEIGNDDVRAAHGATVGQLDREGMHYLRARGLDERTAQSLLLMGFVREVVDRVQTETVRDRVWDAMLGALNVDLDSIQPGLD